MGNPLRRLGRDLLLTIREVPAGVSPEDPSVRRAARSITELYGLMALGLGAWVIYLAFALPERSVALHYDVTWVGFDCFLIAAMVATAWFAYRLDPRVELAAGATATLVIVDAWFDITTAPDAAALRIAILMAVLLEFPLALLSLRVARNVERSRRRREEAEAARPAGEADRVPAA